MSTALSANTTLAHYTIVCKIGAGGMGEVYRARDEKLIREVAIKVLPGDIAQDEERLMRFKREAQVLASLNHPNIAAIYGFEESNHIVALVMELVEGLRLNGGRAIAYINAERKLKIVDVDGQGSKFDIGESGVLFGGKPLPALPHNPSDWDVPVYITADGKRVLLPVPVETSTSGSLTLVTNWMAALQK